MKTYTVEQKIKELELGIRIENLKINKLKSSQSKICDVLKGVRVSESIIANSEDRIEALGLVW